MSVERPLSLSDALAAERVFISRVDDAMATAILRRPLVNARHASLWRITCLGLARVLQQFPALETVSLQGHAAALVGELGPLTRARAVAVHLQGHQYGALRRALETIPLVGLSLSTAGESVQFGHQAEAPRDDSVAQADELLATLGRRLHSLEFNSRHACTLGPQFPNLEVLRVDSPETRLGSLPRLRRLWLGGRLTGAGAAPALDELTIEAAVHPSAIDALGCRALRRLDWRAEDNSAAGQVLAWCGPRLEALSLEFPTSADALVRANPALAVLKQLRAHFIPGLVDWACENELLRLEEISPIGPVDDASLARLLSRFASSLRACWHTLGVESLAVLEREPLTLRDVAFHELPAGSLRRLARTPCARSVETLDWISPLDSDDLDVLTPENFPRLQRLWVDVQLLSDQASDGLKSRFGGRLGG